MIHVYDPTHKNCSICDKIGVEMNPQETLKEIKSLFNEEDDECCVGINYTKWLIARVEQLEKENPMLLKIIEAKGLSTEPKSDGK